MSEGSEGGFVPRANDKETVKLKQSYWIRAQVQGMKTLGDENVILPS